MRGTRSVLGAAVLALAVAAPLAVAQTAAETKKDETTIAVNGTARVYRKPDYVDMNIGVTTSQKTAGGAQTEASEKMSKVIEAVKKLNLEKSELQTGTVRLWPKYVNRNSGSGEVQEDVLVGYSAEISLRIRTSDVEAVPRTLDAAIAAGATRIEEVEFGIKEAIEAREEAIRLASQAATRKARVLAESLELRVGRIVTASSTTQQHGWWGRNYGNRMMMQMQGGMESGSGAEGESPVVPGQIEVWAQVDLTVAAQGRE
jgi:uncharacterized protein YggE